MARNAFIVTDLGYGDAGKGTTVDFLSRNCSSSLVIRHNGGAQAAHNVITPDGRHHTFAQFGSGSFEKDSSTFLSQFMLINPLNMVAEANHLIGLGVHDIWDKTFIHPEALIITPWQKNMNRFREIARGDHRHGSCGQGIGETASDAIDNPELVLRVCDIEETVLREKLFQMRELKKAQLQDVFGTRDSVEEIMQSELFSQDNIVALIAKDFLSWKDKIEVVDIPELKERAINVETLIFEGAQGVLLDENFGFHPFTTWSTTTHENALKILDEISFTGKVTKLGVIRSYSTRHGEGPFVTENKQVNQVVEEAHNSTDEWQGGFRNGWLDLVALRYAIDVCGGIDALVVTGLDWAEQSDIWKLCASYIPKSLKGNLSAFRPGVRGGLDIKKGEKGDLFFQEQLTKSLAEMTPYYVVFRRSQCDLVKEVVKRIEYELNATVYIESYGPKASDKALSTKDAEITAMR